ncbi:MAG: PspC domain-containing protein [Vicinamibacterales bacterium]
MYRSRNERMLGGVLGGMAKSLGWSATRVRVAYVLLSILSAGFPGIAVYIALWIVVPEEPFTVTP